MKIFKNIGRLFLIVTEEERYIKPEDIKAVLFVGLDKERHREEALRAAGERFKFAQIKEIKASSGIDVIRKLWPLREEQFSAVLVLSLDPAVISAVYLLFHCYFLLYNRFGQWFLIRRKTLYEFLAGRKGTDKEALDWKIPKKRLVIARCVTDLFILPFLALKNVYKATRLFLYLLWNLPLLFTRRAFYGIKKRVI